MSAWFSSIRATRPIINNPTPSSPPCYGELTILSLSLKVPFVNCGSARCRRFVSQHEIIPTRSVGAGARERFLTEAGRGKRDAWMGRRRGHGPLRTSPWRHP
jgi:hypothetical protein